MLRKESGQTMEAAAESLDLDKSEYFRFLKGQRLPHLLTLLRLSKKYGVTLDWWFSELDALPANKAAFRQKTFELRALSLLKKFPPPAQNTALAVLAALAKNSFNTNLPAPKSRPDAYT
jgi:transcriptional regulator with XRE-family HTH domain